MDKEPPEHLITDLRVRDGVLAVSIDGQPHRFELAKFSKRLADGTAIEQAAIRVSPAGYGLHWPLLDEDLTIDGLMAGRVSMESDASFERWLASRPKRPSSDLSR